MQSIQPFEAHAAPSGYIETIVLNNFKSYAGRHTIGPMRRFSAIIGPNGSGKSNTLDAVSFVLGIGSRQLRSSNLLDLVYRRPGAPVPARENKTGASVELHFRKSDGTTMVFERKIQLTGTATSHLDGRQVTQDEFAAVLSSLGILVKARNFLVFQGDVEQVAQKEPMELTRLLEQISGSASHAEEYSDLESKLMAAQNEIRFLQTQRAYLETKKANLTKEVKECEAYEALQTCLREKDAELHAFRLYVNESQAGEVKVALEEVTERLNIVATREESLLKVLREMDAARAKAAKSKQKAVNELATLANENETMQRNANKIRETVMFIKGKRKERDTYRQKNYNQTLSSNEHLEEVLPALQSLAAEAETVKKSIGALDNEMPKMTKKQTEEYKTLKAAAREETVHLQSACDKATSQNKRAADNVEGIRRKLADLSEQHRRAQVEEEKRRERVDQTRGEVNSARQAVSQEQADLEKQQEEAQTSIQRRQEMLQEKAELETTLHTLNASKHDLDRLLQTREQLDLLSKEVPGIYGQVVDLCKPSNRQYAEAVSAALGRYADHIVCDTFDSGRKAIEILRRNKWPPRDFIPLDNIHPPSEDGRLQSFGARLATQCVTFDAVYAKAFNLALGNCLVVDTLDDADRIANKEAPRKRIEVKVVTLKGERILKNGNFSIDTSDKNIARGLRTREAEETARKLEAVNAQLAALGAADATHAKMASAVKTVERMQNQLQAREQRLAFFEDSHRDGASEVEKLEGEEKATQKELTASEQEMEKSEEKLQLAEAARVESEGKLFSKLSAELGVTDIRRVEADIELKRKRLEAEERKLLLQVKQLSSDRDRTAALVKKSEAAVKAVDAELKNLMKEMKQKEASLQECEGSLTLFSERETELKKVAEESKKAEKEHQNMINERKKDIEEVHHELESLRQEHSNLEDQQKCFTDKAIDLLHDICRKKLPVPFCNGATLNDVGRILKLPVLDGTLRICDANHVNGVSRTADSGDDTMMEVENVHEDVEVDYEAILHAAVLSDTTKAAAHRREEKYQTAIAELRQKMAENTPNLKAHESLEKAKNELAIMTEKHKETSLQKNTLQMTFKKLKEKRRTKFSQCYIHVKKALERIYSELTSAVGVSDRLRDLENVGGTAFLDLENPLSDEPFLTGLIFHAMPPAKRFRDMQQLSGGEKTMAALALLFAMQSYRASPFFIVDEVDAALDPKNVASLANYLRNVSFQVVMISLKETLYAHADCLFGIYKDLTKESSGILSLPLWVYQMEQIPETISQRSSVCPATPLSHFTMTVADENRSEVSSPDRHSDLPSTPRRKMQTASYSENTHPSLITTEGNQGSNSATPSR